MFRSLIAASALMLAAVLTPALADDSTMPQTISLTGHGEVHVAPDMAMITIGVQTGADTARDALTANTAAMQAIFAKLKQAGIADKDVQTSNFSVQPRYDYNDNTQPPKLVGYDVLNTVTVSVRKLDDLGMLLDQVVSAGSNQINGIAFQVSQPETAMDEARQLAVRDAARKASVYTTAANVKLGPLVAISEGGGYQPPIPMQAKMLRADNAGDVPIVQGEQSIAVDVNMVWEIN